jgi:hypothetical protein
VRGQDGNNKTLEFIIVSDIMPPPHEGHIMNDDVKRIRIS